MTESISHLLPIKVKPYPGEPMEVQNHKCGTWAFKPFKLFDSRGSYIGEIIHSTSEGHGIPDAAEAEAMANRIAVATNCFHLLMDACQAIDAEIELHGVVSEQTVKMARYAVAMSREVERLVQA